MSTFLKQCLPFWINISLFETIYLFQKMFSFLKSHQNIIFLKDLNLDHTIYFKFKWYWLSCLDLSDLPSLGFCLRILIFCTSNLKIFSLSYTFLGWWPFWFCVTFLGSFLGLKILNCLTPWFSVLFIGSFWLYVSLFFPLKVLFLW